MTRPHRIVTKPEAAPTPGGRYDDFYLRIEDFDLPASPRRVRVPEALVPPPDVLRDPIGWHAPLAPVRGTAHPHHVGRAQVVAHGAAAVPQPAYRESPYHNWQTMPLPEYEQAQPVPAPGESPATAAPASIPAGAHRAPVAPVVARVIQ